MNGKTSHVHGSEEDILMTTIRSKLIYIFHTISTKVSAASFFFEDIDKLILKFTWKCKRPRITKIILKKKNRFG